TGISEWCDFEVPRVPSLVDGKFADYLYKPSAATESQWGGAWGILRIYRNDTSFSPATSRFALVPLSTYNSSAKSPTPDPLFDSTAILFVYTSDLTYSGVPSRPRLNQNVRREPLILRANAGECIKVTLRNDLPATYADLPGYTGVNMLIDGFNQNDVAPSM